jgi:hypothetical protein
MKVRFMFDVFVDQQFVACEGSLVVVKEGSTQAEALQACLRKAESLSWYVADAATNRPEGINRSQVTFNVSADLVPVQTAIDSMVSTVKF